MEKTMTPPDLVRRLRAEWSDAVAALDGWPGSPTEEMVLALVRAGDDLSAALASPSEAPAAPMETGKCWKCLGRGSFQRFYSDGGFDSGTCLECRGTGRIPAPQVTTCDTCGDDLPTPVTVAAAHVEDQRALRDELNRRGEFAVSIGMNRGNSWDQISAHVLAIISERDELLRVTGRQAQALWPPIPTAEGSGLAL